MTLPTFYPAQVGSPYTTLVAEYTTGDETMAVANATKLPTAPNLVCLAGSAAGEFRYAGKNGNTLTGVIALRDTPDTTWPVGTFAFRGIAAYDLNTMAEIISAWPPDHHVQHNVGGDDEISVAGLSGRLADPQNADQIVGKQVILTGIAANKILQYDGEKFVVGDKAGASGAGDIAVDALWIAPGDLPVGVGAGSGQRLAVGADPWMQLRPRPDSALGVGWAPPVPDLLNRVLHEVDVAGNPVEIHQVYIPKFVSAGAPQENLNGLILGGFWVDKYPCCHPAANAGARGVLASDNPGAGVGAASKPHVVPWTDVTWHTAKQVIKDRGGSAGLASASCTAYGAGSKTHFYVEEAGHLIGRRVVITQNGVDYIRRIVKTGGNASSDALAGKLVEVYPALPQNIVAADSYCIQKHYLLGGYEWASLGLWSMTFRYRFGLGHPKGNNNWGKSAKDPRSPEYEGIPDPTRPGFDGHLISRTLTGSGPLSWSLNGKASGPMDLAGNVWEWSDLLVGGTVDYQVSPGYPGEGHIVPSTVGLITEIYAPAPTDGFSLGAELFVPTTLGVGGELAYDNNKYSPPVSGSIVAGMRSGPWSLTPFGLYSLYLGYAPTVSTTTVGFRGGS